MSSIIESPAFATGYCERLDEVARQSAGLSDQINGAADLIRYWRDRAIQAEQIRAHLLSDEAVERAAAAIRSLPAIPGFDKHKMRKSHGEAYRLIASTAIKAALGEKP